MSHVSFIGGAQSGKTCVAYMLSKTANLFDAGTSETSLYEPVCKREDLEEFEDFKFSEGEDAATQTYLSDNVGSYLEEGEFPPHTEAGEFRELELDFKIPKGSLITHGVREREVGLYELSGEYIDNVLTELRETETVPEIIEGEKALRSLFESNIFVFLIDSRASLPLPKKREAKKRIMKIRQEAENDTAGLIDAIKQYKKISGGDIKKLGLLLTKQDLIRYQISLENKKDYTNVIKKNLPKVFSELEYLADEFGIDHDQINYFKSGIKTVKAEKLEGEESREPKDYGPFTEEEEQEISEEAEERSEDEEKKPAIPLKFYVPEYLRMIRWLLNA